MEKAGLMCFEEIENYFKTKEKPVAWKGHWLGSQWRQGARSSEEKVSINPNNGNEIVSYSCSKQLITNCLDLAEEAKVVLAEYSFKDRMAMLGKICQGLETHKELFVQSLQVEVGKPRWDALEEVESSIYYLQWLLEHQEKVLESLLAPARLNPYQGEYQLHPLGITAAYLPFSTAVASMVSTCSAALVAGCPLVLFSSSHTVLCSMLFASILEQANLGKAGIHIVFGDFDFFRYALTDHRIAAVIYTGSKEHCDRLNHESRAIRDRKLILQSGGKNSILVHSSAQVDLAVKCSILAGFKSAGQLCSSVSRIFVYRSLLTEFCEKLVTTINDIRIGVTDDFSMPEDDVVMGPLYSQKAKDKFLRFQTMGSREAQETLVWGKAIDVAGRGGHFVTPGVHLMGGFDSKSAYQSNVLFCPDLAIYGYDVLSEAIVHMNETDSCFAASFIGDESILNNRSQLFKAPNLFLNMPTVEQFPSLPLAGRSVSSQHLYSGPSLAMYLCYPQFQSASKAT